MMSGLFSNARHCAPGYAMMGGYASGAGRVISAAAARRMGNALPRGATVDRARHRIVFAGSDEPIDVVGSPVGQRDETFRIGSLVDPTIVVPEGSAVHIAFVNADPGMSHNFVLTSATPPFAYEAMMQAPPAFPAATTALLAPLSGNVAQRMDTSFVATAAGTYTYLCTVPGHAQRGMYGRFIVEGHPAAMGSSSRSVG